MTARHRKQSEPSRNAKRIAELGGRLGETEKCVMPLPSRRGSRVIAVVTIAIAFAVTAPWPAATANAGGNAAHTEMRATRAPLHGHGSVFATAAEAVDVPAKQPKRLKTVNSSSTGLHLSKRDYVELGLLALSPFVFMGLFLFVSGYRRLSATPPASKRAPASVVNKRTPVQELGNPALRVPEVAALFWVVKALSTAMGESTSDYLVHAIPPVAAVLLGFAGFAVAMAVQFSKRRYVAWAYWLAVVMVGVFGTMAADVLHVGFGVPYLASAALYAIALVAVFVLWHSREHTLSIHSIDTRRRETFYWAAVVTTFALGTAVGDVTALTLHLGYLTSILLFGGLIAIPIIGFWKFHWNAILAFWFAYVVTRPLGASFADWLGKPMSAKGLGFGAGTVSLVLTAIIAALVAYLSITRSDVQLEAAVDSRKQRTRAT
jgi:uncharacterized membrane-anchored protein